MQDGSQEGDGRKHKQNIKWKESIPMIQRFLLKSVREGENRPKRDELGNFGGSGEY